PPRGRTPELRHGLGLRERLTRAAIRRALAQGRVHVLLEADRTALRERRSPRLLPEQAALLPLLVRDANEVEAPRRRRRARVGAVGAFEERRQLLRGSLDHRAYERAHHVTEEAVGRELEL